MAEVQFLRPQWFLALLPLALLLILLWRRRARDRVWHDLVDGHLLPHLLVGADPRPRRLPLILLGLGWLAAVLALAGPVWQQLPQPVFATSAKRVILLDLSPSMNAADILPSRLTRARFEVLDLLRATREGQVALVAFGPEPFVVSPLTGDAQTIAAQVPQLSTDLIPVPGPRRTDRALELAGDLLGQAGEGAGDVILISDALGEIKAGDLADQTPAVAAAAALGAAGHRVSVLAVGTSQGAPVPDGDGGFAQDLSGTIRIARLDREGLATLAKAGRGRLVEMDAGDGDTRALTATPLGTGQGFLAQEGLVADQWREEGPWLLLALLPLAALGFRRGWLVPMLALAALLPPQTVWALGWDDLWQRRDQQGARALAAADPATASLAFADPAWRAAAHYRNGDFGAALDALAGQTGAEADYNRGNALARLGRLDESIAAYERALGQEPGLVDARANLDLVRLLKAQQEQDRQELDRQTGGQTKPDGSKGQARQDQSAPVHSDQSGGGAGGAKDERPQAQASGGSSQESGEGPRSGQPETQDGVSAGGKSGDEGTKAQADTQEAPASDERQSGTQATNAQSGPDQQGAASRPVADPGASDSSSPSQFSRQTGGEPGAGDLGESAIAGEADLHLGEEPGKESEAGSVPGRTGARRDRREPAGTQGLAVAPGDLTPQERERQQALDAQLNRVPDDPAGLLRQRFLLQHLRREGRLQ